jgi:hypothetical protein
MANRVSDWTVKLNQQAKRARQVDVRPSQNDFWIFTLRVVDEISGSNLASEFIGTYDSYDELLDIARERLGHPANVQELLDDLMKQNGFASNERVWSSQRGDVGVFPSDDFGIISGVCMGGSYYTINTEGNFNSYPIDSVVKFWEIR